MFLKSMRWKQDKSKHVDLSNFNKDQVVMGQAAGSGSWCREVFSIDAGERL